MHLPTTFLFISHSRSLLGDCDGEGGAFAVASRVCKLVFLPFLTVRQSVGMHVGYRLSVVPFLPFAPHPPSVLGSCRNQGFVGPCRSLEALHFFFLSFCSIRTWFCSVDGAGDMAAGD